MRTIYRISYLMLSLLLVACTAASPAAPTVEVTAATEVILPQPITLENVDQLTEVAVLETEGSGPSLAFNPDGTILATGTGGGCAGKGMVSLWDVQTGTQRTLQPAHTYQV